MHRFAIAILVALAGCSPKPPTDGLFGCADGRCPTSHPYCHTDALCYATPETDAGPRPDAYTPDAPGMMVDEFGRCASSAQCPMGLECVSGFCGDACAMGSGTCASGRVCAPMVGGSPGLACLVDCNPPGTVCPPGTVERRMTMGAMMVCHCAPRP
ncbi:MAG: hypothetical protein OHK0013_02040 [Sandaracinaceae bacterium]